MRRTNFLLRVFQGVLSSFKEMGKENKIMSAKGLVLLPLLGALPLCAQVSRNVYWGYGDNVVESGIPSADDASVAGAIYIPAGVSELYKDREIRGLRIGLNSAAEDVELFVVKQLDGEPLAGRRAGKLSAGITYQQFDEPYVPDGEPFYVGYSLRGTEALGLTTVYHPDGCWVKDSGGAWENAATDPDRAYNALNIALWFFGSDLPFDVRIIDVEEMVARPGEPFTIKGRVDNMSAEALRNYTISYSIDGGEARSAQFEEYMGFLATFSFSIEAEGVVETGSHVVRCELVEANGASDDYAANNVVETRLIVTDRNFARRMVVEEGTGTWCGWCPRGTVALKEMYTKHPDTFIGIAVHWNDEMKIPDYAPIAEFLTAGLPACAINRDHSFGTGISSSALEQAYTTVSASPAIAAVGVKAELDPAGDGTINAEASVEFLDDYANADYRLAFVVLEDGVTGYTQQNNYSGSGSAMGGWENLPRFADVDFDHVARGIYDYDGLPGSLPSAIEAGRIYTCTESFPLPEVQATDSLDLVALLIDAKTGEIMNAAKTDITTSGVTGIGTVGGDAAPQFSVREGMVVCDSSTPDGTLEVYDASGRRVANRRLPHGTYIVKFTAPTGRSFVGKVAH